MKRLPFTLLIHIALAIILAGAIITHFFGIQGEITLKTDAPPTCKFRQTSGPGEGKFPFTISLQESDIEFYPGTTTPMDFHSTLYVDGKQLKVSMNNVGEYDGWRFYQSGIAPDTSTLAVSHDPWGTGITYFGYVMLLLGMSGFFLQRKSAWRALLRKRGSTLTIALLIAVSAHASDTELPTMQRPLAANFGKAYVYWNDRICPMQTMARDVTAKLYGSTSYRGMTAEQVLAGWLFYFDTWEREYFVTHDYAPEGVPADAAHLSKKQRNEAERQALIRWLGTGEAFKIYPYHSAAGHVEWLSLTGRRPSKMSLEQWKFMQTTMPRIKQLLLNGENIHANEYLDTLISGQRRYAGTAILPSDARMKAERIYNATARPLWAAIASLALALLYLWHGLKRLNPTSKLQTGLTTVLCLTTAYTIAIMGLLWWISGHLPLSNGPETMMFMGLASLIGALICRNLTLRGSLSAVAAMALFVAAMAGHTPRIGALMPVLASPLLSVHVMLIMTAYVLFLLMAVLACVGLCVRNDITRDELCRLNRLLLLPSVFLLAAGIFVGAVWANQSWGRYWGWDPKETCALITLLVYSLPMHWASPKLACFRRPKVLHIYLLAAVTAVLFTYFGANYLLPGLHSYA